MSATTGLRVRRQFDRTDDNVGSVRPGKWIAIAFAAKPSRRRSVLHTHEVMAMLDWWLHRRWLAEVRPDAVAKMDAALVMLVATCVAALILR